MRKSQVVAFMLVAFAFLFVLPAHAQAQPIISVDHVDGLSPDGSISEGATLTFHLRYNSGTDDRILFIQNGFRVYSDDLTWTNISAEVALQYQPWMYCEFVWPCWFDMGFYINYFSNDGTGADTVGIAAVSGQYGIGLPENFDDVLFEVTIGPVSGPQGASLVFDSSFYPPAGYWEWYNFGSNVVWGGPYEYFMGPGSYIAPKITSTPPTTVINLGETWTYDVDAEGEPPPTYTLASGPDGMTIDEATGLIEWTSTEMGTFYVSVVASNGILPDAVQSFSLTVIWWAPSFVYYLPDPVVVKTTDDPVLWFYISGPDMYDIDLSTIRLSGKIPAYLDGYPRIEDDMIVTNFHLKRFLAEYRPITGSFDDVYELSYDYYDGTHIIQTGDISVLLYPGDVNLDGIVDIRDLQFLTNLIWGDGEKPEYEALADIDGNGILNPLDLRALHELIY